MLTKKNMKYELTKTLIKWLLLTILLAFLTAIQCSDLLNLNQIKPNLIFPLAVSFFMFNNIKTSSIFAIICGFFMDCFSERAFGFSSIFLIISCIAVSFFCKQFVRIKFLNFIFLNTTILLLFELTNFILLYISLKFKNIWIIWINHIFPLCAITTLISPIFYLTCKQLYKFFNKNKLTAPE